MPQTLKAGNSDEACTTAGFVLIEMLVVVGIIALVAGMAFAAIPRATGHLQMSALARAISTLLVDARTAAIVSGKQTLTLINTADRRITNGERVVVIPADLNMSVLSSGACRKSGQNVGIVFLPDGSSCGAVIRLVHGSAMLRIRINWYTGYVGIVSGAGP